MPRFVSDNRAECKAAGIKVAEIMAPYAWFGKNPLPFTKYLVVAMRQIS